MPPRRGRIYGVPIRRGRGRQPIETEMERNMRILEERLEAMEKINIQTIQMIVMKKSNHNPPRKNKKISMKLKY